MHPNNLNCQPQTQTPAHSPTHSPHSQHSSRRQSPYSSYPPSPAHQLPTFASQPECVLRHVLSYLEVPDYLSLSLVSHQISEKLQARPYRLSCLINLFLYYNAAEHRIHIVDVLPSRVHFRSEIHSLGYWILPNVVVKRTPPPRLPFINEEFQGLDEDEEEAEARRGQAEINRFHANPNLRRLGTRTRIRLREIRLTPDIVASKQLESVYHHLLSATFFPASTEELFIDQFFTGSLPDMTHLLSLTSITFSIPLPHLFHQSSAAAWPRNLTKLCGWQATHGMLSPRPNEVYFASTLTDLHLPIGVFSDAPYSAQNNLITFPPGLKRLIYHGMKHGVKDWILPDSLTELRLGVYFDHSLSEWSVPPRLESLNLGRGFLKSLASCDRWPLSLIRIRLGAMYNQPSGDLNYLPSMLKILKLGLGYQRQLNHTVTLPETLHTLEFSTQYKQSLSEITWPPVLTRLYTGSASLENVRFPPSLLHLVFSDDYNEDPVYLNQALSTTRGLQSIRFGAEWDQDCSELKLPSQLQWIEFWNELSLPLDELVLPTALVSLSFNAFFSHSIEELDLPHSLRRLIFAQGGSYTCTKSTVHQSIARLMQPRQFYIHHSKQRMTREEFCEKVKRGVLEDPADDAHAQLHVQTMHIG